MLTDMDTEQQVMYLTSPEPRHDWLQPRSRFERRAMRIWADYEHGWERQPSRPGKPGRIATPDIIPSCSEVKRGGRGAELPILVIGRHKRDRNWFAVCGL